MTKHTIKNNIIQLFICLFLAIITVSGWPVDFFEINDLSQCLLHTAVPAGTQIATEYTHSVEKTTVIDEYIIINGKLWCWQEFVSSSNAGMPSVLPKYMHFYTKADKFVFRGGRLSREIIYLRVGNETFGHNSATLKPFKKIALYKVLPDRQLSLSVVRTNFICDKNFAKQPFNIWQQH